MSQKYTLAAVRTTRHSRKAQARLDDATRVTAWQALSTAQKIASLDGRLGVGIGAKRQRSKLNG